MQARESEERLVLMRLRPAFESFHEVEVAASVTCLGFDYSRCSVAARAA